MAQITFRQLDYTPAGLEMAPKMYENYSVYGTWETLCAPKIRYRVCENEKQRRGQRNEQKANGSL